MDSKDVELFTKVVELKSFTAAAREYETTHSSISKRISKLEKKLGTRLINRTTRSLNLTEAGETFYEHCLTINHAINEAWNSITEFKNEPKGRIRVSSPVSFARLFLAPTVSKLLKKYKDLQIDIQTSDNYVCMIKKSFDISIQIGPLQNSSLIARRISSTDRILCATPEYIQHHGMPRQPKDLLNHNCLTYKSVSDNISTWQFLNHSEHFPVKVSGNFQTSNCETIAEMAKLDHGIAYLPLFMIHNEIKNGQLLSLLPDYTEKNIGIYATYTSRDISNKIKVFIDYLVSGHQEENTEPGIQLSPAYAAQPSNTHPPL